MTLAFSSSIPWAWTLYAAPGLLLAIICYRRFFHPLHAVPGPFVPAVTRLYLWYHNIINDGSYYKKIDQMHAQYGPIVRIAPNEIHLTDPENYDKIYSVSSKFYKDPLFYDTLGVDLMFNTISNDVHRRRRAPLNHFFSRRAVFELEDIVQEKVKKLCRRIQESLDIGKAADLGAGSRAVSIDVITEYAFDDCWNHLDAEDYASWFSEAVRNGGIMWWTFQQFPFLVKPMQLIPEEYSRKMSAAMNGWIDCVERTRDYVTKVNEQFKAGIKPKRRTIFHELLDPPDTEDGASYHPTIETLNGEALSACNAAADTAGNAMATAAYHVVTNLDIYNKLTQELREAFPDPSVDLDYATLEKLPYLTGVVKEGQRLSYGIISRLPRATPDGGATFNGYFVPAGTTVSMSSWVMHRNEDAFPSPDKFDPTRWMDPDQEVAWARERCLVPFSRGSRSCIGQNLAVCELYIMLGTLFRRFDNLAAFDVGPEDLKYVDYFMAFHPKGARAIKVVAKGGQ